MKATRLLAATLLALAAQPAVSQPALVRVMGPVQAVGTTATIPITVAVPRANTILVSTHFFPCLQTSVADTQGNLYELSLNFVNNCLITTFYKAFVTKPLQPGDQITVTYSGSPGAPATAYEFTRLRNESHEAASTTGDGPNGFTTPTITVSESNELILGYVFRSRQDSAPVGVTPDPSFTQLSDAGQFYVGYKVASAPGGYNFSGTFSTQVDAFVNAQVGSFRSFRFGEVNGDGVIDIFDVVVASSAVVGNLSPGTAPFTGPFAAADVNRDGVLDIFDLIQLIGFIVGNVPALPV